MFEKINATARLLVIKYASNAESGNIKVFIIQLIDKYFVCFFKIINCSIIIERGFINSINKVPINIKYINSELKVLLIIIKKEKGINKAAAVNEKAVAVL